MYKNLSKKDKIVSVIRVVIWLIFVFYSFYIFSNNLFIVKPEYEVYNLFAQIFVLVLWLFITFMGIVPLCMPKAKLIQFVFGIFLILIGYYIFINDWSKNIFVWDMLRVLWAFLVVVGPIWLCVLDKCKKQEEEANIEIIEV